jgi:hypothetical protein
MAAALWSSVIAVVGTLCGGLSAGLLQVRSARTARRETRREEHFRQALAAVSALAAALADHRRAMWVLEHHRLTSAPREVIAHDRDASHTTRSAVTGPLVQVGILLPALSGLARDAAQASYALRDAPDLDTLATLRVAALHAVDRLVEAAGEALAPHGRVA